MDTWIVTGGAGFIGSNFVRLALARSRRAHRRRRQAHLRRQSREPRRRGGAPALPLRAGRHRRSHRRGSDLARAPAQRPCSNFAAETHVDRSIDGPAAFVQTNVCGTFELLDAARHHVAQLDAGARERFRFLHVSTDEVYGSLGPTGRLHRDDALRAELALLGLEGRRRPPGAGLPRDLRPAGAAHQLLEQLRAVPVSREADPADDPERARGQAAADLRRRRQRARLAATSRTTARACCSSCNADARARRYNLGGGERAHEPRDRRRALRAARAGPPGRAQPGARAPPASRATRRSRPSSPIAPATTGATPSTPPRSAPSSAGGPQRDLGNGPRRDRALVPRPPRLVRRASRPAATPRERLGLGGDAPPDGSRVRDFPDPGSRGAPQPAPVAPARRRRHRLRERRRARSRRVCRCERPRARAQRRGKLRARFRARFRHGIPDAETRRRSAGLRAAAATHLFWLVIPTTRGLARSLEGDPRPLAVGGCMRHDAHRALRRRRGEHPQGLAAPAAQRAHERAVRLARAGGARAARQAGLPGRRHRPAHAGDVAASTCSPRCASATPTSCA